MNKYSNRITRVTHQGGVTRYVGMVPEFTKPQSRDLLLFHVDQLDDEPRAFFADGEWSRVDVFDGHNRWLYTIEQGPIDPVRVVDLSTHFLPVPAPQVPLMARFHVH